MVDASREIVEAERNQRITCGSDQLDLNDHRARAEHIDVALIELAEAPTCRTIGAPNRLNLIALEEFRQLVLILRDNARERHSQVITQSEISLAGFFMFAAFQNFEDELIAFFTIFAH